MPVLDEISVLKLPLLNLVEKLERLALDIPPPNPVVPEIVQTCQQLRAAILAHEAAKPKQEAVAWRCKGKKSGSEWLQWEDRCAEEDRPFIEFTPLFALPPDTAAIRAEGAANLLRDALRGDGLAAMGVATAMPLRKQKGERDTEFVKRIAIAYMRACGLALLRDNLDALKRADEY